VPSSGEIPKAVILANFGGELVMNRIVFLFLTLVLAGLLRAQTSPPALVLRGGTLVDVASGNEISDSVVVLRGDRIERVGSGNTGVPEGARIIDIKGKWIIPGLIDSHAHAENPDETPFSLYLANGVTTIRNPGGNITVLRLRGTDFYAASSLDRVCISPGPFWTDCLPYGPT
jgi:hypothetical protein